MSQMADAGTVATSVRMSLVGNGDNGDNRPALGFAGPVKRFGDNVAVDHIDLAVPAGSFFGLVGPNGADFGDQYSDLLGGDAGHQVKIPNPMYYLP